MFHILYTLFILILTMVFQLAPIIAGTIGSAIAATGKKTIQKNIVSGFTFGAPYAFGTYVGFPGNYRSRSKSYNTRNVSIIRMPYGRSYSRYGRRYSRYPRYPSRYSRYTRRPRRSYYGRRYY